MTSFFLKQPPKKSLTTVEALQKLQRYCVYQDRCHQEVRYKLLDLNIYGQELEEIIAELVSDNFLNEERFAQSYARGKFRIKRWGRNRIRQELKRRAISDYCIRKAMQEIEESDYLTTLEGVLTRKRALFRKAKLDFTLRKKLADHAIRKGYESHLVWELVRDFK